MKNKRFLPFCLLVGILIFSSFLPIRIVRNMSDTLPLNTLPQTSATSYTSEILSYLNELRRDPPSFYHKYVKDYVKQKSRRFTSYYTVSLRKTLLQQAPLPPFKSTEILKSLASKQLDYLTKTVKGKYLTHDQGSLSFSERIKGTSLHCFAENLYRSQKSTPLEVVLDLLIDQGVSSLGHRKNILSPAYNSIGIESAIASNGYRVTVMDFSCPKS